MVKVSDDCEPVVSVPEDWESWCRYRRTGRHAVGAGGRRAVVSVSDCSESWKEWRSF